MLHRYDALVRTTLTLDEDVAAELKRQSRRTGKGVKELVNDALRVGLRARSTPAPRPYRLTPASLRAVVGGVNLDRALRLADPLDDEAIAKKLEMRK
jgi:hypothetical protein